MTKIVILGAGGKMGYRCSSNLLDAPWQVSHVEVSAAEQERLQALDIRCRAAEEVLPHRSLVSCRTARTCRSSSPIPAIRRSSMTRATPRRAATTSAAWPQNRASSAR